MKNKLLITALSLAFIPFQSHAVTDSEIDKIISQMEKTGKLPARPLPVAHFQQTRRRRRPAGNRNEPGNCSCFRKQRRQCGVYIQKHVARPVSALLFPDRLFQRISRFQNTARYPGRPGRHAYAHFLPPDAGNGKQRKPGLRRYSQRPERCRRTSIQRRPAVPVAYRVAVL